MTCLEAPQSQGINNPVFIVECSNACSPMRRNVRSRALEMSGDNCRLFADVSLYDEGLEVRVWRKINVSAIGRLR